MPTTKAILRSACAWGAAIWEITSAAKIATIERSTTPLPSMPRSYAKSNTGSWRQTTLPLAYLSPENGQGDLPFPKMTIIR